MKVIKLLEDKKAKTADTVMPENIEDIVQLSEVNNLLNIYSGFSGIEKQSLSLNIQEKIFNL